MKRTALTRKTPMPKGKQRSHNSTLRTRSRKTAKRYRECRDVRQKLVASKWLCECCLRRDAVCCHEIANGPLRLATLDVPALLLAVCARCNCEELTDKAKWPVAWQLGMLRASRPEDFDLELANDYLTRQVDICEVDTLPPQWHRLVEGWK